MPILLISPGRSLDRWTSAIKKADPSIEVYLPGDRFSKDKISFALAWDHPKGFFKQYPNIRCISSFGAGADHLLSDKYIPDNIRLVRIIDPRLSGDMLEFTFAVIMKHIRKLNVYCRYQKDRIWKKHGYGKIGQTCVGIMGTGKIGHRVAEGLASIGFNVRGWSRSEKTGGTYSRFFGRGQLDEFLSGCNILVCLLPLTTETRGIVDHQVLEALPAGAYLLNLGRGAHIAEPDLIKAIDSGHLSGAHLDVFESEPLPAAHPFWKHEKIDITPHVASLTDPVSVVPQVLENYHLVMENREPNNQVSREKGY